jgi:N-acetyl-gamma-glutamyl-phosphate reductase
MKTHNIAILGASGYTGAELIRLLRQHPNVRIKALAANTQAGQTAAAIFPHLSGMGLPDMVAMEEVDFSTIHTVFCCLPHATSQTIIRDLPHHLNIIDLSADFRLRDPLQYQQWYGEPHKAEALQREAVYGLSEHYRDAVRKARLIANPGCYPTCSLLPLIPLLKAQLVSPQHIIIDAKSGVSGAGRSVKQNLIYNEVAEGLTPYSVNHHRHMGELAQEISFFASAEASVTFVPHLVPMRRGMISTLYVHLTHGATLAQLREVLLAAYNIEPFVQLLPEGHAPSTHSVRGTNHCHIGVFEGATPEQAILVSAIDNLIKGASGQAIQNMNLMQGWNETLGLEQTALFP